MKHSTRTLGVKDLPKECSFDGVKLFNTEGCFIHAEYSQDGDDEHNPIMISGNGKEICSLLGKVVCQVCNDGSFTIEEFTSMIKIAAEIHNDIKHVGMAHALLTMSTEDMRDVIVGAFNNMSTEEKKAILNDRDISEEVKKEVLNARNNKLS